MHPLSFQVEQIFYIQLHSFNHIHPKLHTNILLILKKKNIQQPKQKRKFHDGERHLIQFSIYFSYRIRCCVYVCQDKWGKYKFGTSMA